MRQVPSALILTSAAIAFAAAPASAQVRILLADRDADTIWTLTDRNNNGVIDEPSEIAIFYNGSNAEGTPAPLNPNCIGITRDGRVYIGDQDTAARQWLVLRDLDRNGNAQSEGESQVAGTNYAFPVGFAEDAAGHVFLCNAGNGFGPDQVFLCQDLTGEGNFMDAGESIGYVTINGFGTNGTFSPQELAVGADGALYLRNSGAAGNNIYRLVDGEGSGFIDQASEFAIFFGTGNTPGTPNTAGFALEIDPMRPRAFYTLQLATGGVDQLVRAVDVSNNNDAQGADESTVVFSTGETGFTSVDVLALPDGRVFISDNSGNRIISLFDADGNNIFSAGERSNFLANTSGTILAARGMVLFPCPGDFNRDLVTNPDDLADFITCFFLDIQFPGICPASDYNHDGFRNPDDLADFITSFFLPC